MTNEPGKPAYSAFISGDPKAVAWEMLSQQDRDSWKRATDAAQRALHCCPNCGCALTACRYCGKRCQRCGNVLTCPNCSQKTAPAKTAPAPKERTRKAERTEAEACKRHREYCPVCNATAGKETQIKGYSVEAPAQPTGPARARIEAERPERKAA